MRVITFLSEKGGTGKTTLTTTLARLLHERGYSVLVIDGDPQAHSTFILKHSKSDGLFNLIRNDALWSDCLLPVENSNRFWLLPSAQGTSKLVTKTPVNSLRKHLDRLDPDAFDFVLIDTAPSISDLHVMFYHASDFVIMPAECEMLSLEGLRSAIEHLQRAQGLLAQRNESCAELLGIVPNKFNGAERVQYQAYGWLQGKYGMKMIFDPVRQRTAWKQANTLRVGISEHATDKSNSSAQKAVKEARSFMNQVLARMEVYHG